MPVSSQAALFQTEEQHKETVYREFDKMRKAVVNSVDNAQQDVNSGAYEDQDAFVMHGALSGAKKHRHETEALIQKLYKRPYFAHIEAKDEDSDDSDG